MVDELDAEFASDAPCQPAQARTARCKDQRELRGHVEIFSDNPRTANQRGTAQQTSSVSLGSESFSVNPTYAIALGID